MTLGASPSLVRVLSPAPRTEWKSVLQSNPEGTIYQTPEWLDACCRARGYEDASRLYETFDGQRIILPLVRRRPASRVPRTAWSMPDGWGFAGAIGSRSVAAEDVAMVLADVLRDTTRLIVKPGPLTARAWAKAPARGRFPRSCHIVDLSDGFGKLWSSRFSSGTRRKVRRAEKEGVELQWGGSELLKVHWDLYLRWTITRAKERGIPVPIGVAVAERRESLSDLETVARCLGERCQVGIAWVDGQAAASSILLLNGSYAHAWRATSDRAVGSRYVNYLRLSRLLERAAELGHEYVEMGESGGVRSLIEFKESFGARPAPYEELRFEPRLVSHLMRGREQLLQVAGDRALRVAARLKRWRPGAK